VDLAVIGTELAGQDDAFVEVFLLQHRVLQQLDLAAFDAAGAGAARPLAAGDGAAEPLSRSRSSKRFWRGQANLWRWPSSSTSTVAVSSTMVESSIVSPVVAVSPIAPTLSTASTVPVPLTVAGS
jgi:hypothetical protein